MLEFAMFPVDKGEGLSKYVSRSLEIIEQSGVKYRFGPMGTVLEGGWDEVMAIVRQCYEKMREDCNRIVCHISIDYRKDRTDGLTEKIASVEEKLGKKLVT